MPIVTRRIHRWVFSGPHGGQFVLDHHPRLTCRSAPALLEAVRAGLGVGLILEQHCTQDIAAGRLVRLWPDWHTAEGTIYLVFTAIRGMPPAVRALIDFLADQFAKLCGAPDPAPQDPG